MEVEAILAAGTWCERRLPFFTGVPAGFPSPAEDYLEAALDLNQHLVGNAAATFFVRVKGESMRDAGIRSGDILVVDRSVNPSDKSIVVAMLDGEFTVKRLRKKGSACTLEAANPDFPGIPLEGIQEGILWGVVTYVIHRAS